jgi:ParB family chromosome partitioning protein
MVSDDEGSTSEELLESALVANIHRQDLEELDEARALQRLLAIHGSQTALAKRLHRSQGWVSQRLALLNLTPELQARIGQEPIDLLRAVGNKPAQEQEPALQALKEKRERKEAGGKRRPSGKVAEAGHVEERGGADEADGHYGVIEGAASEGAPLGAQAEADRVLPKTVPEPRADTAARLRTSGDDTEGAVQTVPWDEPESLAMLLDRKVESDDDFFTLLLLLGSKAAARDPQRLPALLSDLALRAPASAE